MQYIAAILALAATALAVPAERRNACTFGQYRCSIDHSGIEICDISGVFVNVGPCPSGTSCEVLPQNGPVPALPFCTNNPTTYKRDYVPCTPGQYTCLGNNAIQVCDTQHQLQKVGDCPKKSHCDYIGSIPFCLDN